jgi:hypothetical protein
LSGFQGYLVAAEISGIQYGQFVGVPAEIPTLPSEFALEQNYPNPFNPSTQIQFALPEASHVKLEIYNTLGEQIATLVDEPRQASYYSEQFNATGLASGLYFYRLKVDGRSLTKKMVLTR